MRDFADERYPGRLAGGGWGWANGAGARRFARQRAAIAERTPELLELFDAMAAATRALAARNAL